MRKVGLATTLLAAMLAPVCAQVSVEVALEQDQYLLGEPLVAAVRITNRSGQTLRLGAEGDWLTFTMDSRGGGVVARNGDAPVVGEFELPSAKTAVKRVDLQPWFLLSQPGHYTVRAMVRIAGWDRDVAGSPKGFDIIQGANLWQQEFGVPARGGASNSPPEVRKYSLQQANYLKAQLRLYLRVTDADDSRIFRVRAIGSLISFSKPEARLDQSSNLHVLYQNGSSSFSYTSFNPDGDLLLRQTYDRVQTRPRLRADEQGVVSVAYGVRRLTPQDVPPSEPGSESEPMVKPLLPPDAARK
jgi:hypothetical protein